MENNVLACRGAPRPPLPHVTAILSARAASAPGAARRALCGRPEARRCAPRVPVHPPDAKDAVPVHPPDAKDAALAAAWPGAIDAPSPLTEVSVAASNRDS